MRTTLQSFLLAPIALSLLIALSGCSIRTADLTLVSTRTVSLNRVDLDHLPTTSRVVGETSKWVVLFIPIGLPHLKDAVDDALTKGNGDLMTDAVVYQTGWTALLFGQNGIRVEGDVVRTRGTQR